MNALYGLNQNDIILGLLIYGLLNMNNFKGSSTYTVEKERKLTENVGEGEKNYEEDIFPLEEKKAKVYNKRKGKKALSRNPLLLGALTLDDGYINRMNNSLSSFQSSLSQINKIRDRTNGFLSMTGKDRNSYILKSVLKNNKKLKDIEKFSSLIPLARDVMSMSSNASSSTSSEPKSKEDEYKDILELVDMFG